MRQLLTRTAVGMLAIGLFAGCSANNEAPTPSLKTDDKPAAAESLGVSAEAAPPRVVLVDTGTVIAEREFKVPGSKDTVTVGVKSLIVEGKTMKLQLVITPEFSSIGDSHKISILQCV